MVMMSPHTEISRAQVWQWVRHGQTLQDGRPVTREFVRQIVRGGRQGEDRDGEGAYAEGRYEDAAQLMLDLVEQPKFEEFLTPAGS
jgi:malate synthase